MWKVAVDCFIALFGNLFFKNNYVNVLDLIFYWWIFSLFHFEVILLAKLWIENVCKHCFEITFLARDANLVYSVVLNIQKLWTNYVAILLYLFRVGLPIKIVISLLENFVTMKLRERVNYDVLVGWLTKESGNIARWVCRSK